MVIINHPAKFAASFYKQLTKFYRHYRTKNEVFIGCRRNYYIQTWLVKLITKNSLTTHRAYEIRNIFFIASEIKAALITAQDRHKDPNVEKGKQMLLKNM